jgi:phosphatidylserine/phosphatidylglycerophosphate/cardiolipin synthase-like enzyme
MSPAEFKEALRRTLEDRRLSRPERQALQALVGDREFSDAERAASRAVAFELARDAATDGAAVRDVLDWLHDVVKLLDGPQRSGAAPRAEACFSPGQECVNRIVGLFRTARASVDACVFTITDDRISDAIIAAHKRGVRIRIVTDNDKVTDAGSDVLRLSHAGVGVRIDVSPFHMHHKFAIFDGARLLTGSYNWTRGAANDNEENFVVLADRGAVAAFQQVFDALWTKFGPS